MKILWDLVKNLKPSFMIAFVVLWNLLFFAAHRLNGGAREFLSATPILVMAAACLGLPVVGFGAVLSVRFRGAILRQTADMAAARPGLLFLGVVGSLLFAALLAIAVFGVGM